MSCLFKSKQASKCFIFFPSAALFLLSTVFPDANNSFQPKTCSNLPKCTKKLPQFFLFFRILNAMIHQCTVQKAQTICKEQMLSSSQSTHNNIIFSHHCTSLHKHKCMLCMYVCYDIADRQVCESVLPPFRTGCWL